MVRGNVGAVSYIYPEEFNWDILDIRGVLYSYFSTYAFFMVETSEDIYHEDANNQEMAGAFFGSVVDSYRKDGWSNGRITSDIEKMNINGLTGWYGTCSMTRNESLEFKSDILLLYCDNKMISFTLICPEEQYDTVKPVFQEVINSIKEIS